MRMRFDTDWLRVYHEVYTSLKISTHFHGIKAGTKIKIITHPSALRKMLHSLSPGQEKRLINESVFCPSPKLVSYLCQNNTGAIFKHFANRALRLLLAVALKQLFWDYNDLVHKPVGEEDASSVQPYNRGSHFPQVLYFNDREKKRMECFP